MRKRPEFRPPKKFPETIDLPCGCELTKEMTKGDKGAHYYVSYFCEEHDPSYWDNYAEDEEE